MHIELRTAGKTNNMKKTEIVKLRKKIKAKFNKCNGSRFIFFMRGNDIH